MDLTDPMTQINDACINKYKTAGKIVSYVLEQIIDKIHSGTKIYDICTFGDNLMREEVAKVYGKISDKGIAYPTCISINEIAGSYCPNSSTLTTICDGDLVKIELGLHIDGFPALIAYTVIVDELNMLDKNHDKVRAMRAISEASKEVFKVMKIGKTNLDVVNIINKTAEKYGCNIPSTDTCDYIHTPGIISYQMSQYVIDGYNDDTDEFIHRLILNKPSENYDFQLRETPFEEDEVYAIDIVMSTGPGKLHKDNCTIYKKSFNKKILLKLKTARDVLNKFGKNRFPECMANYMDPKFKFGLKSCIDKQMIEQYPVMKANPGEFLARAKFTVLIKKSPILIVGRSLDDQLKKKIENKMV